MIASVSYSYQAALVFSSAADSYQSSISRSGRRDQVGERDKLRREWTITTKCFVTLTLSAFDLYLSSWLIPALSGFAARYRPAGLDFCKSKSVTTAHLRIGGNWLVLLFSTFLRLFAISLSLISYQSRLARATFLQECENHFTSVNLQSRYQCRGFWLS